MLPDWLINPNEMQQLNLDVESLSIKNINELREIQHFVSQRFFAVDIFFLRESCINKIADHKFKHKWIPFGQEESKLNYIHHILFCLNGINELMMFINKMNLYERYRFFCTNNDQYEFELKTESKSQIQLLEQKYANKNKAVNRLKLVWRGNFGAPNIKPTLLTVCT